MSCCCFFPQFLAIMNTLAMNNFIYVFGTYIYFLNTYLILRRICNKVGYVSSTLVGNDKSIYSKLFCLVVFYEYSLHFMNY